MLDGQAPLRLGFGGRLPPAGDLSVPFFFFTLVSAPRRVLSLKLSDTKVYEPWIRARLGYHNTPSVPLRGANPSRFRTKIQQLEG